MRPISILPGGESRKAMRPRGEERAARSRAAPYKHLSAVPGVDASIPQARALRCLHGFAEWDILIPQVNIPQKGGK